MALSVLLLSGIMSARGQVAVKTNLLGWATTTTNIGLEVGAGRHTTLQLMGYLNPWELGQDRHYRLWTLQPEYRYWFCSKFNGHFLGFHVLGGQYNAKNINFPLQSLVWGHSYEENNGFPDSDHEGSCPNIEGANSGRHVEGWHFGLGISYGYQWILSKHWNLEASIGVGYVYSPMTYYGRCQRTIDRRHLNYIGPTNAQISFMYVF